MTTPLASNTSITPQADKPAARRDKIFLPLAVWEPPVFQADVLIKDRNARLYAGSFPEMIR
jgi:hypothetical protein